MFTSGFLSIDVPVFQTVIAETGLIGVRGVGMDAEGMSSLSDIVWFTVAPLTVQEVLSSVSNSSAANDTGACGVQCIWKGVVPLGLK